MADRAYTSITRYETVVGNHAVERRFSLFPGHTLSLRQVIAGRGYIEWIDRPVPDWDLDTGGGVRPAVPSVPEWSEACDETGATLWAEWNGPDMVVRTWCMAFHRLPALARGIIAVPRNPAALSGAPHITVERLALRRDGAGLLEETLTRRVERGAWIGRRAAPELNGAGGVGLLLGTNAPGRFELFEPDPALVRIGFDSTAWTKDPADPLRCVIIVPYTGSPVTAASLLEEAIRQLHVREAARHLQHREQPA